MKISNRVATQRQKGRSDLWSLLLLLVVVGAYLGAWVFLLIHNAMQNWYPVVTS